ncbi:MAG: cation transporter [Gammaproteobacteria bacterium]|nr:cation transporter [Gammaproteobacteria bacterium]
MHVLPKAALIVMAGFIALPAIAEDKQVTLSVPGMTCAACPTNVKRALGRMEGVKTVEVRPDILEAVVKYDNNKASVEDLIDMVALAGYPATVKRATR